MRALFGYVYVYSIFGQWKIDSTHNMFDRTGCVRVNIELEDLCGQPQGRTGVGNVDNAADVSLNWCGTEDGVSLGS